jgi:hypothetical protein
MRVSGDVNRMPKAACGWLGPYEQVAATKVSDEQSRNGVHCVELVAELSAQNELI